MVRTPSGYSGTAILRMKSDDVNEWIVVAEDGRSGVSDEADGLPERFDFVARLDLPEGCQL